MIAVPRIPEVQDGQMLSTNLVNHIIKRTEYAADLLSEYKCIAGTSVRIEQKYAGRIISSQAVLDKTNSFFIGISAATGGSVSIQSIDSFVVNKVPANISQVLGTATYLSGTSYRLTNNNRNEVGAVWHNALISGASFSASFNYTIGGSSDADGFALIFCQSYFLAGEGGGLGYQGAPTNSAAVEIDIFKNPSDPNNSHIAVLQGGSVITHLALSSVTVRPSGTLAVNYSNKTLNVSHNGLQIISYPIDLISIIGTN